MFSINNASPKVPLLSKHIEYYYFLSSDKEDFNEKFTHYPHYRTTVNVYRNSRVELNESDRIVEFAPDNDISTVLTNNRSYAKDAYLKGAFNVIGIVFKPLGINHFLLEDFSSVSPSPVRFFDDYWPKQDQNMAAIFAEAPVEKKVRLLDAFFKGLYRPLEEERITLVVDEILRSKGTVKVSQLQEMFEVNRRTLLRLSHRYLGCSISEFKRVVKFRNSLDEYQKENPKPSLTELSYKNNYYDQSDFIAHFRSLAGEVPKRVLSKVTAVGRKDLYWKFGS